MARQERPGRSWVFSTAINRVELKARQRPATGPAGGVTRRNLPFVRIFDSCCDAHAIGREISLTWSVARRAFLFLAHIATTAIFARPRLALSRSQPAGPQHGRHSVAIRYHGLQGCSYVTVSNK
jgi:hypothetical protein